MQKEIVSHDVKCNPCFSVKDIFLDNHNWDEYRHLHRDELRQVEIDQVGKMLHCKDGSHGFFLCIIVLVVRGLVWCILGVIVDCVRVVGSGIRTNGRNR